MLHLTRFISNRKLKKLMLNSKQVRIVMAKIQSLKGLAIHFRKTTPNEEGLNNKTSCNCDGNYQA